MELILYGGAAGAAIYSACLALVGLLSALKGPGGSMLHVFQDDLIHGDGEGELYMRRWVLSLAGYEVHLHDIRKPDDARHLHDHPWPFVSLLLRGWYAHDIYQEGYQHREAGSLARFPADLRHRIVEVGEGGALSLVLTGRRSKNWGFWVPKAGLKEMGLTLADASGFDGDVVFIDRIVYFTALQQAGGSFRNERTNYLGWRRA